MFDNYYSFICFSVFIFLISLIIMLTDERENEKAKSKKIKPIKPKYKLLKPRRIYRIAKHNNAFYPQYRFMFMWFDLNYIDTKYSYCPKAYYNLDDAKNAIRRDRELRKKPIIVWENSDNI